MPKISLDKRKLVIGVSALAVIGAGGAAWVFLRPMLAVAKKPVQETAATEPGKAGEKAPEKTSEAASADAKPSDEPAKAEAAVEKADEPKKEAKAEAAHDGEEKEKSPEKHDEAKPDEKHEKSEGGDKKEAAAPLPLPDPPSEAEILIRRLQDIQERVAMGDAASFIEQPRLLRMMARRLLAAPPETWAKPQNARALVLYLLSGGSSAVGRRILGEHTIAAAEEPLAKGAIAYLEGVEGADRDNLLNLDPRMLDASLGAQVAFVQSILLTGSDRPRAIANLDLARLLAPGGLVEEAALRREVGLLSETTEYEKFAGLARQYWARFRSSPYAENFLRQFLVSAARVSLKIKPSEWAQLEDFIATLSAETQRSLYLVMAQTASVGGNVALGDMAAKRALELTPDDGVERQRALLYRALAEVGGADISHGPDLLRDVSRSRLPPGDQPLYDAAALVSARIFRAPDTGFAKAPAGAANQADAAMAQAETSIKEADDVMESVRKTMERKTR